MGAAAHAVAETAVDIAAVEMDDEARARAVEVVHPSPTTPADLRKRSRIRSPAGRGVHHAPDVETSGDLAASGSRPALPLTKREEVVAAGLPAAPTPSETERKRTARRRKLPPPPAPPRPDHRAALDASGLPEPPTPDEAEHVRVGRRGRLPPVPAFSEASALLPGAAPKSRAKAKGKRKRAPQRLSEEILAVEVTGTRLPAAIAALEGEELSPTEPGDTLPTICAGHSGSGSEADYGGSVSEGDAGGSSICGASIGSAASSCTRRGKRGSAAKKRRNQANKQRKKLSLIHI